MRCRFKWILLVHISLLFTQTLHAQSVIFETFNSRQGLSQNSVTAILEDSEGYMWFGTRGGLNKFDGYTFTVYEHNPADSTSISNNNIRAICEDKEGTIWIATQSGLNAYNPRTGKFKNYFHKPSERGSISDDDLLAAHVDREGTLWIGSRFGLSKFDHTTQSFTLYQHEPHDVKNTWAINSIQTIYEDAFGNLWVGTHKGLSLFNRQQQKFTRYLQLNEDSSVNCRVVALHADKEGFLWIGTMGHGLRKMNIATKEFITYKQGGANNQSINNNSILCIKEDAAGDLWIGTQYGGLNRYNRNRNTFEYYINNPYDPTTLSNNSVMSLYEDRAKRVWIGTHSGGVSKLDKTSIKFTLFKNELNNPNSLRDNQVSALYEDAKGNLWIGNRKGIDKYHLPSGKFTHYMYKSQLPGELSRNTAIRIVEDRYGKLWIALYGGGLLKFDPATERFTWFLNDPANKNSLAHNEVLALLQGSDGYLWIGTRNGLDKLDLDTETITHYNTSTSEKGNTLRIMDMHEDSLGVLWLATYSHGLMSFNKKGIFTRYIDRTPQSLLNEKVQVLYKGSSDRLWFSSDHGGLYYLNPHSRTFHKITKPASLAKIVINGIIEDNKGNLWLSTLRNGICKYSIKENTLRFYDERDGVQNIEFTYAAHQNKNGEIYFGGVNGFNKFNPSCIHDNPYPAKVKITGFKVFDKPRSLKNKTITLPYSDNFFSFDFLGLSFTQPEKNEYAYRLDGFDKKWNYTGTRKFASYTNLDPGEYTFRVKAANNDKVWGKDEAQIKLIITPPFWKTWWFESGLVISVLLAGYLIYKFRVRSIQAQNAKLESQVMQRTEQLKQQGIIISRQRDELQEKNTQLEEALHIAEAQQAEAIKQRTKAEEANKFKTELLGIAAHDLKNPIGCFMIYADLIKDTPTDTTKVKKLAGVIKNTSQYMVTLISDLLHTVRLESGHVLLKKEKQNIGTLLEEMVERNRIQAQWKQQHIHLYIKGQCMAMVDVCMIKEVIENLISNAIKFTPRGKSIYIDVTKKESLIQIQVEDEGVGLSEDEMDKLFGVFQKLSARPTEGEGSTGLGLSIVKKLVELHNGRVKAESKGIDKGSIFTVELPAIVSKTKRTIVKNSTDKTVL